MTCKDCIHYEACGSIVEAMFMAVGIDEAYNADENCPNFADKSLYIKLPCKVGDTVWHLYCRWGTKWHIGKGKIWGISVEHTNKVRQFYIKYRSKDYDGRTENATGMLGSMVFLTREEAEVALEGRK